MPYALDKAKILIVDDMKPMLSLTTSVLKIFGFRNISTAVNGEEAFQIVCKEDPDLIITDWMMEPMDGLELSKLIRKSPMSPNPYVPILMMTGFSSKLRVEGARDTGITEFLVKPFSSRDLFSRVVQIIERPRQFVDAGTFFGPDRRRRLVRDYEGVRRRDDDQAASKSDAGEDQKKIMDILGKLRDDAKNM
jgi:two-component system, chemotaxis family, chemotaxis protein CheY